MRIGARLDALEARAAAARAPTRLEVLAYREARLRGERAPLPAGLPAHDVSETVLEDFRALRRRREADRTDR